MLNELDDCTNSKDIVELVEYSEGCNHRKRMPRVCQAKKERHGAEEADNVVEDDVEHANNVYPRRMQR